jgi:hypothetical protein
LKGVQYIAIFERAGFLIVSTVYSLDIHARLK